MLRSERKERGPVYSASAHLNAEVFLQILREYRRTLPRQQLSTLRGQALKGDVEGAWKGLQKVLDLVRVYGDDER